MGESDWRKRIEDHFERKLRAEVEAKAEAATAYERELGKHKKKFRCHVRGCVGTSAGPYVESIFVVVVREWADSTDWNRPTWIKKCEICGQWTCPDHLHRGICMECAQKM